MTGAWRLFYTTLHHSPGTREGLASGLGGRCHSQVVLHSEHFAHELFPSLVCFCYKYFYYFLASLLVPVNCSHLNPPSFRVSNSHFQPNPEEE